MTAYTKADGTITSSATAANTAYTLTAADITALTSEASTSTDATRISEINGLISAGAGSAAYKKADGTITASSTTANTEVSLNMADINSLQSELNTAVDPRKTEITGLLDKAIPITQINSDLKVDISEGVKTDYNKTATDILEFKDKSGNAINVSDLLSNIIDNLGSSDQTQINKLTGENLTDIQSVTANLLQKRSEVGTMQNRMDSAQTNNETANQNMTDILSKTEDIDITEKTMEYSTMQTTYTAALQVSAKILPMSLLTYL
jgi:flagellar hook-associated protein 3 FlgL